RAKQLRKPAPPVCALKQSAAEPERKHSEENAQQIEVKEGVGDQLPPRAAGNRRRPQPQKPTKRGSGRAREQVKQQKGEIDRYVYEHQLAHRSLKRWKAERAGT